MDRTIFNASHVAGYCNELLLWQLFAGIVDSIDTPVNIEIGNVLIDNGTCHIDKSAQPVDEPLCVWSVGAILSYLSSGRIVFGGRGYDYLLVNPDAQIPTLRPEHASLQQIVYRCMAPQASKRPTIKELKEYASKGLEDVSRRYAWRPAQKSKSKVSSAVSDLNTLWPEEME